MQNTRTTGYIAALLATVIWSGNFIVARALHDTVPPVGISFWRWAVASIVLLPFGWRAFRRDLPVIVAHKRYFLLSALTGVTMFNTMLYVASHTTEALNLSLIATSSPVFMILFARVFLGEAVTPRRMCGLAMAFTGVIILVTRGSLDTLLNMRFAIGDLWMLAAAMCFATYSVLARRKPQNVSGAAFLVATFIPGLVMLSPVYLLELAISGAGTFTPAALGSVLYIGIGASLISYFLWNTAVSRIGPSMAGLVYYSLPLFSGLEAYLLLGEPVTLVHLFSGILVISGIAIATRG